MHVVAASKSVEVCLQNGAPQLEVSDELIAACQRGEREAQRTLYLARSGRVMRLLTRLVGPQEADDVAQQVFLQVFRKIESFQGHSSFDTWLWRVAVNEAHQYLRKNRKHRAMAELTIALDRRPKHTQVVADRELLECALGRIDPELRAVFLLRELEGLSYRELASACDVPEGTIASRLNRARRELREHLVQLGWER